MQSKEFLEPGYGTLPPDATPQISLGDISVHDASKPRLQLRTGELTLKKYLFSGPEDLPRTEYTEQDIASRLSMPDGFVDSSIFDDAASHSGIKSAGGMKISSWGREEPTIPYERVRAELDFIGASRKAYEGPVYLQGQNPTCHAWTAIHALLATGVEPSLPFAKDLLNDALPREDWEGGISIFAVAGLIERYYQDSLRLDIPVLGSNKVSVQRVATLVKNTVDAKGALLATVSVSDDQTENKYHAICIAGYDLNEQGNMNVQVIDSGCGVGSLSIEGLTREFNNGHLVPVATVTKPA